MESPLPSLVTGKICSEKSITTKTDLSQKLCAKNKPRREGMVNTIFNRLGGASKVH
jgi:hypothetical protein